MECSSVVGANQFRLLFVSYLNRLCNAFAFPPSPGSEWAEPVEDIPILLLLSSIPVGMPQVAILFYWMCFGVHLCGCVCICLFWRLNTFFSLLPFGYLYVLFRLHCIVCEVFKSIFFPSFRGWRDLLHLRGVWTTMPVFHCVQYVVHLLQYHGPHLIVGPWFVMYFVSFFSNRCTTSYL